MMLVPGLPALLLRPASMDLAPFLPLLSVLALVLAGFASVAISLTVWRRRRAALRGEFGLRRLLAQLALVVATGGALVAVVSLALRSFFPRRGELLTRAALVVRHDPAQGIPVLSAEESFAEGARLLHYRDPAKEARGAALRLRIARLGAREQLLRLQPLEVDHELVREERDISERRRLLEQRAATLRAELRRIAGLSGAELLDKIHQRGQLRVAVASYAGTEEKLAAELQYAEERNRIGKGMLDEEVISTLQHARDRRDIAVVRAERNRLEARHRSESELLQELDAGVNRFGTELREQRREVLASLDEIHARQRELASRQQALEERVASDRSRQKRARDQEILVLGIEISEAEKQLVAAEKERRVEAPWNGAIHWRHPAPAAATPGDPILVFGAADCVFASFRMRRAVSGHLRESGEVSIRVDSDEVLEPRLTAKLARVRPIPNEPGMVIAELDCVPTDSQLRFLARGHELEARLDWAPPLWFDPLFVVGAGLALLSILVQLLLRVRRPRQPRRIDAAVGEAMVHEGRPAHAPFVEAR